MQWSDLSQTQQRALIAGGVAEVTITAYALVDLAHRPSSAVRGPKALWVLASVVQPFGPLAYLWRGRR